MLKVWDWEIKLNPLSRPLTLVIEVSTRCNFSCLHCFRQASSSIVYTDMSLSTFKAILQSAVESGVKRIVFSGWGEPTINPHFTEMLSEAKRAGLSIAVNTNGAKLEDLAETLLDNNVEELYVSIDAVDVMLYKKIRTGGDLTALLRGLKKLNALKRSRRSGVPVIKAIFTINKLNIDHLPKLVEISGELGIDELYLSHYIHFAKGPNNIECLSDPDCTMKFRKYTEKIQLRLIDTPIKLWIPNLNSYTNRQCPYVYNKALFVRVDGKVTPCMYLAYTWRTRIMGVERDIREFILGDALRENIAEIWRKNLYILFKLYFNYMPSCLDCNLVEICSYTKTSEVDCWGNVPNCAHCPYHYRLTYCPV